MNETHDLGSVARFFYSILIYTTLKGESHIP